MGGLFPPVTLFRRPCHQITWVVWLSAPRQSAKSSVKVWNEQTDLNPYIGQCDEARVC